MAQTVIDPSMLESCVRDVLNVTAPRSVNYGCKAALSVLCIKESSRGVNRGIISLYQSCGRGSTSLFQSCVRGSTSLYQSCVKGSTSLYQSCVRGVFNVTFYISNLGV